MNNSFLLKVHALCLLHTSTGWGIDHLFLEWHRLNEAKLSAIWMLNKNILVQK